MDDTSEQSPGALEQPRYVIECARSSAARCKTCRRKIPKDALRMGILVDGFYGPGYMWHHLECAARRQLEQVEEAYSMEAWKVAKTPPPSVPELADLQKLKEKADEKRSQRKDLPYVEQAPSARSRCKVCEEPIEKGTPRVVLGKEVRFGGQSRVGPMNVHPGCVGAALQDEDVLTEPEGLHDALRENSFGVDEPVVEEAISALGF